jgi:UDP-2-acetamido-2,6-beta-L-arabino-hexul-4-ose reductase
VKKYEIQDLDKKSDERGWLIEVLGGELPEGCKDFGQLHVSVAYPGKVRGNHYHTRKVEWFCVPTGTGQILLKDRETGETQEMLMGVNDLKTIKIEPGTIHAIKNVGEGDMVLLVYCNENLTRKTLIPIMKRFWNNSQISFGWKFSKPLVFVKYENHFYYQPVQ